MTCPDRQAVPRPNAWRHESCPELEDVQTEILTLEDDPSPHTHTAHGTRTQFSVASVRPSVPLFLIFNILRVVSSF